MDKIQKDIELTDNDQITIYELSYTFYIVINQANNFNFSTTSLTDLHKKYEIEILKNEGRFIESELPPYLRKESEAGIYLKCERD